MRRPVLEILAVTIVWVGLLALRGIKIRKLLHLLVHLRWLLCMRLPLVVLVLWVHLIEACRLLIRITLSKLMDWLAIIVWQLLLLVVLDWHLPTRVHWIFPSIWLWLALLRYKHLLRISIRVLLLESLGWAHTRHFC